MKAITIRDLHDRTAQLVQEASEQGGYLIAEQGKILAMLTAAPRSRPSSSLPRRDPATLPTTNGDSTAFISEERNDR